MTLDQYLKREGAPSAREFSRLCGVSYMTIKSVRRGMKLKLYHVAKKISLATSGEVTVKELCE